MRPLFWVVGDQWLTLPVKEARSNTPIAMTTAMFNHPGLFGYDSSDPQSVTEYRAQFAQAAQRSALYPPPPSLSTSYQREHFSECCQVMLTVTASAGVV